MIIFPAIDLYSSKAVRLYKGNYRQMTVYSEDPAAIALDFTAAGADHIHIVDLEGAKTGETSNFETVRKIKSASGAFCEIGGGIRRLETIERYISVGLDRVILGTAAVKDPAFLEKAVRQYGKKIAVGADIKDGFVAVNGWTERSDLELVTFCERLENLGVATLICTDISRDGAMQGANHKLYADLARHTQMQVIASGGVSSIEDVHALRKLDLYGAIIGKAYYTGAVDLTEAMEAAK